MRHIIPVLLAGLSLSPWPKHAGLFAQDAPGARVVSTITFDEGEPSTVHWEPSNGTLYIADNENNQVWSWTEAAGLRKAWTLPDPDGALAAKAT
ncbi:MAG: hypothetical protein AB7F99_17350, partial [Vicinamibacterales bacterium]